MRCSLPQSGNLGSPSTVMSCDGLLERAVLGQCARPRRCRGPLRQLSSDNPHYRTQQIASAQS
jgi:hypothetical protein